jgi:phosphoribosylpyrophosphate synthetase
MYPDKLWAGYTILQMFTRAILPELWEVVKAAWAGNVYGRHGVVEEMIQTAGTLIRAAKELERRREQ